MDLWFLVSKFRKKVLANVAAPLARDNLPGLVSNLTLSTINNLIEKKVEKGLSEQEKNLFYLFQMKIWMIFLKL